MYPQAKKERSIIKIVLLGLVIALLAGCTSPVPATTPPQLSHTPGAPIIITGERIETSAFQVDYPDGWRVVKTSIAGAPAQVVMVAPQEDDEAPMTITVSASPVEATDAEYWRSDTLTIRGAMIYVVGQSREAQREILDRIYDRIIESIA